MTLDGLSSLWFELYITHYWRINISTEEFMHCLHPNSEAPTC